MKKIVMAIFMFALIGACGSTVNTVKKDTKQVITEKIKFQKREVFIPTESVYYYAVGILNIYKRNFKTAESAFLKALAANPKSVYLNYKIATFYLHFQEIDKAVKFCEKALLLNPDFEKAHELLANIYAATNNIKGAIAEYKFLLTKKPDNPTLLLKYGIFLLRGEKFEEAKKIFKSLTTNKKYSVMAYYYLAKAYSQIKLFNEALSYYKKAINLKPDFEQAFYEMALVYQLENKDDKAYANYLKVLKINPDNILAREKIVRYFVKNNDLKGALKHLKKLKELEGDNININIKLALVYMELKRYKKAINILRKFPQFPKARYYEITALLKINKIKEAIKVLNNINQASNYYFDSAVIVINYLIDQHNYKKALNIYLTVIGNLKEKNIKIYKFGLFLFDKAGEYKKGIDFINEALEKYNNVSLFYFYRGIFYDRLGNVKMLIKSMKKAIETAPESADALNYLGYTYAVNKMNLKEAEHLVKKALNLRPTSAAIMDSLGWVYFQKGEYKKALTWLKKAYETDSGSQAEIVYHIGAVYLKLGNKTLAEKFLNEALKKADEANLKHKILRALKEAE